jgi:CubicO group peptidase (beta-lactamase class C family)
MRLPVVFGVGALLVACSGGAPEDTASGGEAGAKGAKPDAGAVPGDAGKDSAPDAENDAAKNTEAFPMPDWKSEQPEDHGLDPGGLAAAANVAEGYGSYCFLVIRHGVLVDEHYWNGHDINTPERSFSIAKSYAGTLVGIAIGRGEMKSLDQSVSDYIPEWKGTAREAITIRNLLSMTSGLSWSAFQDYFQMVTLAQDHSAFALGLPLDKPPGTEWVYDNAAVQVLEPLFRNATGKTIEQYAELHLWSKLGMVASWAHDPAGNPTAYASVLASCRDQARFGYLYLHGGRWAGEQVVPSTFVTQALTPSQTLNRAYGFLFWLNAGTPAVDAMMEPWPGRMVPFAPEDHFAARGFGNQFIDVFPSLDLIVVRFGPDPLTKFDLAAFTSDQRFEAHDAMVQPVLEAVTN